MSASAGARSRWLRIGAPIIAALVVFAYILIWRAGADQMRRSVEEWALAQQDEGVAVDYDRVRTGGFPFLVRGSVSRASIAKPGEWRWSADTLFIDASIFAPNRLVFSADRSQTLDLGGGGEWRVDAKNGRASIRGGSAGAWRLDVRSGPGRIERADGEAVIESRRLQLTITRNAGAEERYAADLAVRALTRPDSNRPIGALVVEARIALRPKDRSDRDPPSEAAFTGGIDIERLRIEADGAILVVFGSLTANADGDLEGALQAEATNPGAFAALLGEIGAAPIADAESAAAALTLAAIAGGGKISAPLVLKNGEVTIAGIRIARLPQIGEDNYAPRP